MTFLSHEQIATRLNQLLDLGAIPKQARGNRGYLTNEAMFLMLMSAIENIQVSGGGGNYIPADLPFIGVTNATAPIEGDLEKADDADGPYRPSWDDPKLFNPSNPLAPKIPSNCRSGIIIADCRVFDPVDREQIDIWRVLGLAMVGERPDFTINRKRGLPFSRLSKAWLTLSDLREIQIVGAYSGPLNLRPELQIMFSPKPAPAGWSFIENSLISYNLNQATVYRVRSDSSSTSIIIENGNSESVWTQLPDSDEKIASLLIPDGLSNNSPLTIKVRDINDLVEYPLDISIELTNEAKSINPKDFLVIPPFMNGTHQIKLIVNSPVAARKEFKILTP